jgi:uncharacterized protein (DUF1697 family)
MPRYAVLLRGINIGPKNRIAMPALREALADAGFTDVQTYVQSGNVVVTSRAKADTVRKQVEALIRKRFGLEIAVLVRTAAELKRIAEGNPLAKVATNPKRHQVTFLERKLPSKTVAELEAAAAKGEQVVARGREVYSWTPDGIARSKLWAKLGGKDLGVTATSRNWTTLEALRELAGG